MFDISTSSKGVLKSIKKNITDEITRYDSDIKDAQKKLDRRFETLSRRFASFDLVMGKLDSQAQTLDNIIKAQFAKDQ